MKYPGLRRMALAAAMAATTLLASCGGGDIVDPLVPTRVVSFGDAFSDVGQSGNKYTVNDGSANNNWTQQVAFRYGLTLTAQSAGGTGYAQGNARVLQEPDAAGGTATLTIKEQVDAFLASGSFQPRDLVLISGGFSDIIVQVSNPALTAAQRLENVRQAARDLATQVRRIAAAGAPAIGLVTVYDLARTPWAGSIMRREEVSQLSLRFNEELSVSLVDQAKAVLYIDSANRFNLMVRQPGAFLLAGDENLQSTTPVCTSMGSGDNGIGISTGAHVTSLLCTSDTLVPSTTLAASGAVFADPVYPTPVAHRLFGDFAFERLLQRF